MTRAPGWPAVSYSACRASKNSRRDPGGSRSGPGSAIATHHAPKPCQLSSNYVRHQDGMVDDQEQLSKPGAVAVDLTVRAPDCAPRVPWVVHFGAIRRFAPAGLAVRRPDKRARGHKAAAFSSSFRSTPKCVSGYPAGLTCWRTLVGSWRFFTWLSGGRPGKLATR